MFSCLINRLLLDYMGSLLVCFETGSFQVAQPDLELKAVLPQFPDCSELQMWATILSSSSLISCFMFKSLTSLVFFHLYVCCAIWIQFCLFLELIQLSEHQYFYSYYLSVWWCFFHLRSWGFSLCYICRLSPMLFPLIPSFICLFYFEFIFNELLLVRIPKTLEIRIFICSYHVSQTLKKDDAFLSQSVGRHLFFFFGTFSLNILLIIYTVFWHVFLHAKREHQISL